MTLLSNYSKYCDLGVQVLRDFPEYGRGGGDQPFWAMPVFIIFVVVVNMASLSDPLPPYLQNIKTPKPLEPVR